MLKKLKKWMVYIMGFSIVLWILVTAFSYWNDYKQIMPYELEESSFKLFVNYLKKEDIRMLWFNELPDNNVDIYFQQTNHLYTGSINCDSKCQIDWLGDLVSYIKNAEIVDVRIDKDSNSGFNIYIRSINDLGHYYWYTEWTWPKLDSKSTSLGGTFLSHINDHWILLRADSRDEPVNKPYNF